AERVVDRLRDGGERPHLSPVEVDGQTMYRVRLGPFPDREEAARVAERVRRGFGLDTWITQ
ncbi:MAG TPA: SPOR domain-containing protein, partial [Thermoanaerobaculia bacterium]|nr:SPOR domain-containing protein [Thermoanaerobaculia bacterium]